MMDKLFYLLVLLVGTAAFFLGDWRRARIAKAHLQREMDIFQEHLTAVDFDLQKFDANTRKDMEQYSKLLDYKRKADEYLAKIEEVITERETWRALYNDQAGGHDNAQALMLDAINKLLHVYRRDTGKSPQLDPMIELVRGEWVSVHGSEARENLGSDGKPKDSDRKPT